MDDEALLPPEELRPLINGLLGGDPVAGGLWLRRAAPSVATHVCLLPRMANHGDVWRCDCLRRWTCTAGNMVNDDGWRAAWRRRRWPWPA